MSARPLEAQTPADRAELLRLADLTLAEYLRYLGRYGGTVLEEDGLLLVAGAHPQPNPYRNAALRLDAQLDAGEARRRADEFFAARRRGYALWVREHADGDLEAAARVAGLSELERLPELVLDRLPEELPPPDGVEIRRAADPQTRLDYLRVVASAWGMGEMPDEIAARIFFDPNSVDHPDVAAFMAYYDGVPLSGAMVLVAHGVALGCQAATVRRVPRGKRLPSVEPGRRGLAESCLQEALRMAFDDLGARRSLCQTSSLGEPGWLQLGYRPLTAYGRYLAGARPAA